MKLMQKGALFCWIKNTELVLRLNNIPEIITGGILENNFVGSNSRGAYGSKERVFLVALKAELKKRKHYGKICILFGIS